MLICILLLLLRLIIAVLTLTVARARCVGWNRGVRFQITSQNIRIFLLFFVSKINLSHRIQVWLRLYFQALPRSLLLLILWLLPGSAGLRVGIIWDLWLALLLIGSERLRCLLLLLYGIAILLLLFISAVAWVILGGEALGGGPAMLLLPRILAAV